MYDYALVIPMLLIIVGAIIMLLNIFKTTETLKNFQSIFQNQNQNSKVEMLFKIHGFLMFLFFFGYMGVAYSIYKNIQVLGAIFVSIIFLSGAIFVYLGIFIKLYMINALNLQILESKEIAKKLAFESDKLKESNEKLINESNCRQKTENENNLLLNRINRSKRMEAVGLLAGGVAHDLNNILSGIVSYPELLLMDLCEGCTNRDSVIEIHKSGIKAAAVVKDLLTLARSVGAKHKIYSLNKIVNEYLASPEHENICKRYIKIKYAHLLDPNLYNVSCSPVHISTVIMNLVYNAAEAINGDGVVNISTNNVVVEEQINSFELIPVGEYVVLEVSDSGIGISKENQERIFEPFFTKKVLGRSGTGLGMSVVWGTMKDHSGFISLDSSIESGTKISLYFMANKNDELCNNKVNKSCSLQGRKEKILIIDDEKLQRKIAKQLLKKYNYVPTAVSSGEEGIELLQFQEFDLVLIDMIMDPGIDGLETYKRIKEFKPEQKVIIVSGFSEHKKIKEVYKLGIQQFVKKPYAIDVLNEAIQKELHVEIMT